jgi:hypothetical protein
MEQLTITLPDEIATQLKEAAKQAGVRPQDFVLTSLLEKLANRNPEFDDGLRLV